MSRQIVLNRLGRPIGFIETDLTGQQSAICRKGTILGFYDPRVGETKAPSGQMLAEGNLLTRLLQRS